MRLHFKCSKCNLPGYTDSWDDEASFREDYTRCSNTCDGAPIVIDRDECDALCKFWREKREVAA
jgi:hypothetical protein